MSSPEITEINSHPIALQDLSSVVALTGAGVSAESGIPTFRGVGGYWSNFRPEELATPQAFNDDPVRVWEWYLYRRELIANAQPNAGHLALVELEQLLEPNFYLITQNVDGLHRRAGSKRVIELHGNIFVNRCAACYKHSSDDVLDFNELPPKCPFCGGPVRPGVVWFGENLDITTIEDAFRISREATLFLVIGTSAIVHPAASLPLTAAENRAKIIEINVEETPISSLAALSLRHPAAKALPPLVQKIKQIKCDASPPTPA
jgi:NAD-dependent deacetylase